MQRFVCLLCAGSVDRNSQINIKTMKKPNEEEREKRFNELMAEAQRMLRIALCLWFGWIAAIGFTAIAVYEVFFKPESKPKHEALAILASAK